MKHLFLLLLAFVFVSGSYAQQHAKTPAAIKNVAVKTAAPNDAIMAMDPTADPNASLLVRQNKAFDISETAMGSTAYDLQTNVSTRNQLWRWEDGTMAGVWTMGNDDPPSFPDRGTAYNYYDGSAWGDAPTERIESMRNGWGSIAPWGANGEVVVSHSGTDVGLIVSTRETKGEGEWTVHYLVGTVDNPDLLWPRVMTTGDQHQYIHVIAITPPEGNGGVLEEGLDGALLYSRSSDGGASWDIENVILDGTGSSDYTGYTGDGYTFLPSNTGSDVAFVVADGWIDLYYMRSTDNGDNWEKTIVWEHPYPFFEQTMVTDTFYCPDGATSIALDSEGELHLAFGLNRAYSDGAESFWFPGVGGIAYWNSNMEPFESDNFKTTLDPDVLFESNHLVGFLVDLTGDGEFDWTLGTDGVAPYYLGTSSMPNIMIDDYDRIVLVYSALTDARNDGILIFRSLFGTASPDGGQTWYSLTEDEGTHYYSGTVIHSFDECVFPCIAPNGDNENVDLIYQFDNLPGLAARGQEHEYVVNTYSHMRLTYDEFGALGNEELEAINTLEMSVVPNPASSTAHINLVSDSKVCNVQLLSVTGQCILDLGQVNCSQGVDIDVQGLASGIYFVVGTDGAKSSVAKMVVE